MSADNYDDLDDLLDDADLQNKILSKSPNEDTSTEKKGAPDVSSLKITEASSKNDKSSKESPEQSNIKANPESQDLPKELEELLQASGDDPEAQDALKMLLQGLSGENTSAQAPGSDESKEPKSFEDTISATMDRLNQSKKSNGSTGEVDEADLMEKLLQDMQKSISQDSGMGGGSAGGLDGLLSSLLSELSSKEVLYDPLKELHSGYPDWFAKNRDSLDKKELERLEYQQKVVAEVITKFEDPKYSDSDKEARDFITEKMVEMQNTGAPPKELVGDVAGGAFPGFPGMGDNAPPDLPGDCASQ